MNTFNTTPRFHITDWTGKLCFDEKEFNSLDDAEEFLLIELGDEYEDHRGEFYIVEKS